MLDWLGRFHLLLLHFPIALVVAAALRECWGMWRAYRDPMAQAQFLALEEVSFCIGVAALFSLPVVITGWLHALGGFGGSYPDQLFWHRVFGTASCVVLLITAGACELDTHIHDRTTLTRILVFASALFVCLTGHLGGLMAHGPDFFSR